MNGQQLAEELERVVSLELDLNNNPSLSHCMGLYRQTAEISDIRALFIRKDERAGYYNIVILGDGRIVDIESPVRHVPGTIHIHPLSSVSEVFINQGSLPQLPDSQEASLVLMLALTGLDQSGPYWAANNPEEEAQLKRFARTLVQEISDR